MRGFLFGDGSKIAPNHEIKEITRNAERGQTADPDRDGEPIMRVERVGAGVERGADGKAGRDESDDGGKADDDHDRERTKKGP